MDRRRDGTFVVWLLSGHSARGKKLGTKGIEAETKAALAEACRLNPSWRAHCDRAILKRREEGTVEESIVLTASAFARQKALVQGARTAGSWSWAFPGDDRPHATIG
jgi:hypothetical protein